MAVLCHPAASEVHRAFAAVLLRRMFVYTTKLWEKVAPATQAQGTWQATAPWAARRSLRASWQ